MSELITVHAANAAKVVISKAFINVEQLPGTGPRVETPTDAMLANFRPSSIASLSIIEIGSPLLELELTEARFL